MGERMTPLKEGSDSWRDRNKLTKSKTLKPMKSNWMNKQISIGSRGCSTKRRSGKTEVSNSEANQSPNKSEIEKVKDKLIWPKSTEDLLRRQNNHHLHVRVRMIVEMQVKL